MTEDTRIWEIKSGDSLIEFKKSKLDLENRLEQWIEKDISLIASDLIIIGRQVQTRHGGVIDVLCLDSDGNTVIIELKRDKTPRDITSQVLDYATWVKDLSHDEISNIANSYLGNNGPIESAFRNKFEEELPETLNENHKMLIVSSEIDESTERIVNYLSDSFGVAINAVKFQYFRDIDGKEYLARIFLIEPSEVEERNPRSKRKPPLTLEEFGNIAEKNGVGELFNLFVSEVSPLFDKRITTRSTVSWVGQMGNSMNSILNVLPMESNDNNGLRFYVYIERLTLYFTTTKEEILKYFPKIIEEGKLWNVKSVIFGYFSKSEEIKIFARGLKSRKSKT